MSRSVSTPSWRKLLPRFETRADARQRRDVLVSQLKDGGRQQRRAGRRLRRCRSKAPCQQPMCPRCVRELRKSFVPAALICIKQARETCQSYKLPITAFSAVLAEEQHLVGNLGNADLHRINERLQRRHQRCDFPLVFAGVDLSFNTYSDVRKQPYWQFQIYGIVVGLDCDDTKATLAHLYPKTPNTRRPLRVRKCSNLAKALSYIIKPYFSERVSYRDDTGRMNIQTVKLKAAQVRELAPWISQYPLTERYMLTGARRYSDRIEVNQATLQRLVRMGFE